MGVLPLDGSISAKKTKSSILAEGKRPNRCKIPPKFHFFPFRRNSKPIISAKKEGIVILAEKGEGSQTSLPPKRKKPSFWRKKSKAAEQVFRQKGKNRHFGGKRAAQPRFAHGSAEMITRPPNKPTRKLYNHIDEKYNPSYNICNPRKGI